MKTKAIILITLSLNLLAGNALLSFLYKNNEERMSVIIIHILTSAIAMGILALLFRKVKKTTGKIRVMLMALLGAFLVPVLSIFAAVSGFGIYDGQYDAPVKGLLYGFVMGVSGWFFWAPLGLVNGVLLVVYGRGR